MPSRLGPGLSAAGDTFGAIEHRHEAKGPEKAEVLESLAQQIEALRRLGHDVLTAFEAGQAHQRIPDEAVLEFATRAGGVLRTLNRWDFVALQPWLPNLSIGRRGVARTGPSLSFRHGTIRPIRR